MEEVRDILLLDKSFCLCEQTVGAALLQLTDCSLSQCINVGSSKGPGEDTRYWHILRHMFAAALRSEHRYSKQRRHTVQGISGTCRTRLLGNN